MEGVHDFSGEEKRSEHAYHPRSGSTQSVPVYTPFAAFVHEARSSAMELPMPPIVSPYLSRALDGMKP